MAKKRPMDNRQNAADLEQQYLALLESLSNWVWETDKDLHFTFISDQIFKETNLKPEQMLGKPERRLTGTLDGNWI